ncbi:hypothetical protein DXG01_003568 [Tephrocybe rancida]|nr:hypothetical protein DXG01_003568 [Tephrocybe rancida]
MTGSYDACAILPPELMRFDSVGVPVPSIEGEVCIYGPSVTKGYFERPDLNEDDTIFTKDEQWMHSEALWTSATTSVFRPREILQAVIMHRTSERQSGLVAVAQKIQQAKTAKTFEAGIKRRASRKSMKTGSLPFLYITYADHGHWHRPTCDGLTSLEYTRIHELCYNP